MIISYGRPFTGSALARVTSFLAERDLSYDEGVTFTVAVAEENSEDGDEGVPPLVATGSLDAASGASGILKCIAVDDTRRGEGLAAAVVSALVAEAARQGVTHLFLFTKPDAAPLFASLGFYRIVGTSRAVLMENRRSGIADFVAGILASPGGDPRSNGKTKRAEIGAVVANCNPCTRGHLHLIETAAAAVDFLYVFVLSDDRSLFSADIRQRMVCAALSHLSNVTVLPTGPYLISAATFPDYFLRKDDAVSPGEVNAELDVRLFAERFAFPLHIGARFVGTEPFSPVTAAYNSALKSVLPAYGISLVEIERALGFDGEVISATRVRAYIKEGNWEKVRALVPEAVYKILETC